MVGRVSIALVVCFALAIPWLMPDPYLLHVLILTYIYSILTLGFILVWTAGRLHFGIAGFWAIGAYICALTVMRAGVSYWLSLPLAGIATGIIGLGIGYIVCRTGGGTFIMLTWAFAEVIRLIIVTETTVLGGSAGIMGVPKPNPIPLPGVTIQFIGKVPYYYLILFLLLVAVFFLYRLYKSPIGLILRSIGQSDHLSESVGIYVLWYRVLAFTIAAFFAGLAGSFWAHYIGYLCPDHFTVMESLYVEVAGIIGGLGNFIAGGIIGGFFIVVVPEVFRAFKQWVPVIYGVALITVILFLRGGLASLPGVIRPRLPKWVTERVRKGNGAA